MSLDSSYHFFRGVIRAVKRGNLFPAAGRVPASPAPGGTVLKNRIGSGAELDILEITAHRFPIRGLQSPLQILHLSDLHLRDPDARLEQLAECLSEMRPDLIVLTGDILTRGWKDRAIERFLRSLPPAPLGRYAVMGNWEYWGGAPESFWASLLHPYQVELLQNRWVQAGPLQLAGTDDWLAGMPDVTAALQGTDPSKPTLVLSHSPEIFPELQRVGVDLLLCGHTHGGQIRFPVVGPFFLPKGSGVYPAGWYKEKGTWMFVNRGIGWSLAPFRWRAPPEIAWIELVPQ